jgi:hypothetical protein
LLGITAFHLGPLPTSYKDDRELKKALSVCLLYGGCGPGSVVYLVPRNNLIFNGVQISFSRRKKEFRDLFLLCKHRAKASLSNDMSAWFHAL